MCTLVFLKRSDTSLELAKHKHGVNTMHTNICATFDMTVATA